MAEEDSLPKNCDSSEPVSEAEHKEKESQSSAKVTLDALQDIMSSIPISNSGNESREALQILRDMGFEENASRRALYYTQNSGVEEAVMWLEVNGDLPELNDPFVPLLPVNALSQPILEEGVSEVDNFKMVFVVNEELMMGVGKIAAQVGHATLGLYTVLQSGSVEVIGDAATWEVCGGRKIVLAGKDTSTLLSIQQKAKVERIPMHAVYDAGKTQVATGSLTVVALFGTDKSLENLTGQLKTL